jgi:hypothetical protein
LLSLYRQGTGGEWQRVFPQNEAGLPIAANMTYQIPDNPIAIRDPTEKLRLLVLPMATTMFESRRPTTLSSGSVAAPLVQKDAAPAAPMVIEIPIAKN